MTSWKNSNVLKSRRLVEEVLDPVKKSEKVVAENLQHLRKLIYERIKDQGFKANLNDIDTSNITDMSQLFAETYRSDGGYDILGSIGKPSDGIDFRRFDGDISQWDVSSVENMWAMFKDSVFNGDISNWDVSKVECMIFMFYGSKFNRDISKWNVSKVESMNKMFLGSDFNGDISKWNVSRVRDMSHMFFHSRFDGDISNWNVERVREFGGMFTDSPFSHDLSKWNTLSLVNADGTFAGTKLAKNPPKWDLSNWGVLDTAEDGYERMGR